MILDGFEPPTPPEADSITIVPPAAWQSPAPNTRGTPLRWNPSLPFTEGVHNRDVLITKSCALKAEAGDIVIAESEKGPVLIASSGGRYKHVLFGFHPLEKGTENQLAIPVLFANVVRWISPDLFRTAEVSADSPGLVELETAPDVRRSQIKVASSQERELPFTLTGNILRFFVGQAGSVRVTMPGREMVYTLNLPETGDVRWTPPPGVRHGLPPSAGAALKPNLWPWLALAGMIGLLLEWILYGRNPFPGASRTAPTPAVRPEEPPPVPMPTEQEVRL